MVQCWTVILVYKKHYSNVEPWHVMVQYKQHFGPMLNCHVRVHINNMVQCWTVMLYINNTTVECWTVMLEHKRHYTVQCWTHVYINSTLVKSWTVMKVDSEISGKFGRIRTHNLVSVKSTHTGLKLNYGLHLLREAISKVVLTRW